MLAAGVYIGYNIYTGYASIIMLLMSVSATFGYVWYFDYIAVIGCIKYIGYTCEIGHVC